MLSALAQLVGSGINYFSQRETNESNVEMQSQANAMNSSIAQENRDFQYKMWKEQTAYNSPQAQMTRLQAAGLNPNLVYGQIAESKMSAPPATPIAHYDAAKLEAPGVGDVNPVAIYQQVKNMQALNALQNTQLVKEKAAAISAASNAQYDVYSNTEAMKRGVTKYDTPIVRTGRALGDIFNRISDWSYGKLNLDSRTSSQRLADIVGDSERAHITLDNMGPRVGGRVEERYK